MYKCLELRKEIDSCGSCSALALRKSSVLGTERLYSCSTELISDYEVFDHG